MSSVLSVLFNPVALFVTLREVVSVLPNEYRTLSVESGMCMCAVLVLCNLDSQYY